MTDRPQQSPDPVQALPAARMLAEPRLCRQTFLEPAPLAIRQEQVLRSVSEALPFDL